MGPRLQHSLDPVGGGCRLLVTLLLKFVPLLRCDYTHRPKGLAVCFSIFWQMNKTLKGNDFAGKEKCLGAALGQAGTSLPLTRDRSSGYETLHLFKYLRMREDVGPNGSMIWRGV